MNEWISVKDRLPEEKYGRYPLDGITKITKGGRKMLNELAKEIHENAVEHGWWDEPRSFGEIDALCHSELSEALEEHRHGGKLL